jgi:uncharacterized membrane protein
MLWIAYPLLIYFGLQFIQPRYLALVLILVLLLRARHAARDLLSGFGKLERLMLLALLALSIAASVANSEMLLRLYPAAMNLGVLALFIVSLKRPPPMIERFARLEDPALSAAGVRYTRDLTRLWCAFLGFNACVAFYTALWSSRETWMFYNALLAYVLMGALLLGERLLRNKLMARYA